MIILFRLDVLSFFAVRRVLVLYIDVERSASPIISYVFAVLTIILLVDVVFVF